MEQGTYKIVKQPNQYKGKFLYRTKKALIHLLKVIGGIHILAIFILATFMAGQWSKPEHVEASNTVIVHDKDTTAYPVMERISQCESRGQQFSKDGTPLTNTNPNGTVDVGKFQINMSAEHIKESAKLGFNVLTEEGNTAYAMYLYTHIGTGPWSSSAYCWNK